MAIIIHNRSQISDWHTSSIRNNTLSFFYTRRVDRPNEVDIRIFPKYDDVEIIKVGNPGLRPQFTNSFELGYKMSSDHGYLYTALYHKRMEATITRIASIQPGSTLIYNIFQNAGDSECSGIEIILSQNIQSWATLNLNLNGYKNTIEPFTVVNKYPSENTFTAERQQMFREALSSTVYFIYRTKLTYKYHVFTSRLMLFLKEKHIRVSQLMSVPKRSFKMERVNYLSMRRISRTPCELKKKLRERFQICQHRLL